MLELFSIAGGLFAVFTFVHFLQIGFFKVILKLQISTKMPRLEPGIV